MESSPAAKPNHLIKEKSPYLLQHAFNPVDWYPWGPAAFEKARKEDKPILVSIGYSTCHWCHVMERESYEDPTVAALMNEYMINIKVDREERPDVDKIYMTAVSAMTGSGGWPLNVFLTPDLKPFYGGTYFPPTSRWGQPAWRDVVTQLGKFWQDKEERKKLLEAGSHVADALKQYADVSSAPIEGKPEWLDNGYKALQSGYDSTRGGFGPAPKFPMPVYHNFLMRYGAASPSRQTSGDSRSPGGRGNTKEALEMSLHTLREMAKGGIYDHLGGGFARYSTDADWHIPHFEKMLYDNAQLTVNYLEAYQISKDTEFKRIARETLNYVLRDMTSKDGGFYSAEDADSLSERSAKEKTEGAFYVWEKKELEQLLSADSLPLFAFRYGVREGGNAAQDPHGEFKNKNILYEAHPIPEAAREFKLPVEEATRRLDQAKQVLFEARLKRPRPHLDDKVLAAWNGLMISAFATAYQVLGEPKDLVAAQKAVRFLKTNLYDAKTKTLYRSWRDGERKILGIADDYAFVTQGLIDLYEADFDVSHLAFAVELNDIMIQRFYDKGKGGFYMTATDQDPHLIIRVKEEQDNVEPAASSVAVLNLLRLAQFLDKGEYREIAQRTLQAFGATLKETPRGMPYMLAALDYSLRDPRQIVIVGKPNSPDTQALIRMLHSHYIPVKIVIAVNPDVPVSTELPLPAYIGSMKQMNGKATAYVCQHYTCKTPTYDPSEFEKQLTHEKAL